MRRLMPCIVLGIAVAGAAVAAPVDPKTIVVSGYAEMQVKPDHATVNIGVVTTDKITTKALAANNVLMQKVVEAIKGVGIADADMQTTDFAIAAQHPQGKEGYGFDYSVTLGYMVSNTLTISMTDLSKAGIVIDAAVKAGANTSNSVDFDAKDRKSYDDKVLTEAVQDAHHNAEVMAAAEHAHVGKMVSMANTTPEFPLFRAGYANAAPPVLAMQSVAIMPGQIPITAQVTVTYAVEP